MPGHGEKLSRKQEALIAVLLTAPSLEQAARQTGVDPSTAWRWMKLPAFAAAYREAKRELVVHATTLLQRFASTAVGTLVAVATDQNAPASARVAAAKAVSDLAYRGSEIEDIQARLAVLEAGEGGQGR